MEYELHKKLKSNLKKLEVLRMDCFLEYTLEKDIMFLELHKMFELECWQTVKQIREINANY